MNSSALFTPEFLWQDWKLLESYILWHKLKPGDLSSCTKPLNSYSSSNCLLQDMVQVHTSNYSTKCCSLKGKAYHNSNKYGFSFKWLVLHKVLTHSTRTPYLLCCLFRNVWRRLSCQLALFACAVTMNHTVSLALLLKKISGISKANSSGVRWSLPNILLSLFDKLAQFAHGYFWQSKAGTVVTYWPVSIRPVWVTKYKQEPFGRLFDAKYCSAYLTESVDDNLPATASHAIALCS